ncbi:pyridoxal phosphate enzyme, YggS family [Sedimentisphaera cyanobacteriorum]|uniref:Pyridoxal phosphate homeostasis protein n=1 Tax=Sedimentisphaera cyanobacteriorum TaxID=1940790 RepID=A0A1Q2HQV1_9BACT|nr:YggS family pyridoxal phosphate-dependent enzyme [Sedimentisphaera cyanobacteriorum]AQQ09828.1 pyridoxal phosphate enzyme, YggS family [Sedimentisphaera cyanobacteriorum]
MSKIEEKLNIVEENIQAACERAGRSRDELRLVAVTKTAAPEQVVEAVRLGCTNLGENRLQHFSEIRQAAENSEEISELLPGVRWHMIGHMQRNKAKHFLPLMDMLHSLESLKLAGVLNKLLAEQRRKLEAFIQINCSREEQKYGVPASEAAEFAARLAEHENIIPAGIMTMAVFEASEKHLHETFALARETLTKARKALPENLREGFSRLSMGMTNDYKIAVEEGATDLRIGSAIFA